MCRMTTSPTQGAVLDTGTLDWIPLEPGQAFKPIALPEVGPRQLLLRVDPGTIVALHRHHGEVHAFTMSGARVLLDPAGNIDVPAGTYVYEPTGNVDSWMAVGDEPCVVHISIEGAMDTFDDQGNIISSTGTADLRRIYLDWCTEHGVIPLPRLAGKH